LNFTKYQHLERFDTDEVEGIELGLAYVFPKLDGTNASVWLGDDKTIRAGSRNRELSLEKDNAGFRQWVLEQDNLKCFLEDNPDLILYGEWLVPHSLKTYREDCWRNFYVFDVFDTILQQYLEYEEYKVLLDPYDIEYIPPIAKIRNGTREQFEGCLDRNTYLIKENEGVGEGIVIKNYDFVNKFGRVVWAKMVTRGFKDVHHKEMGAPELGGISVEERIVEEYVTQHLVDKTFDKIRVAEGGWTSKMIPRLLNTVFHDLINEELWDILKKYKTPKIDFKLLQRLATQKTKELKEELF
jgi:hypothetical protein